MPEHLNDITELGQRLVEYAYPEFSSKTITFDVAGMKSFGQVRWSDDGVIRITCHNDTLSWPEPAILGLLAHEISHPSVGSRSTEEATDIDVIDRGLGAYLAFERAFVNKYTDHEIRRGKDRYLGFQSVKGMLNGHEHRIMENLLEDFKIFPKRESAEFKLLHDTAIHDRMGQSVLMIEGRAIAVGGVQPDSDIKLLFRDGSLYIYVDDEAVAMIPWLER